MHQLLVNRFQYGVGQGCFHGQEISYGPAEALAPLILRFVYDCGSTGKDNALKWPIDQFTNQDKDFPIHAVYLSHFENDHVNGLALLCTKAQVERIYIPYIDQDVALAIIARACKELVDAGASGAGKTALDRLSRMLMEVLGHGAIHGRPVTMVRPGGEGPPAPDFGAGPPKNDLRDTAVARLPGDGSAGTVVSNASSARIETHAGGTTSTLWEVVHWCYGSDVDLTWSVGEEVRSIPGALTSLIPALLPKCTTRDCDAALKWIKANFVAIAKAYRAGIYVYNALAKTAGKPKVTDDHNVTSLCVYSGPTFALDGCGTYANSRAPARYCPCFSGFPAFPDEAASWLATGDAMLSIPSIWAEFQSHFTNERLGRCQTVLMPHHGSGKGNNFNEELVRQHVQCVISAGANNGYRHPGRHVMTAILSKEGHPVVVNENDPLGFTEHLRLLV